MYQLLIKDASGTWRIADTPANFEPAITIESANIADLQDRYANYSQSISLPITQMNGQIFDYAFGKQANTQYPYRFHDARLLSDNTPIAGIGSVCKVLSITPSTIEVQLLSSYANVFTQLQNIDLQEEPETADDEILAIAKKLDSEPSPNPTRDGLLYTDSFNVGISKDAPPAMNFKTILSKLAALIGYSVDMPDTNMYLMPADFTGYKDLGLIRDSVLSYYDHYDTTTTFWTKFRSAKYINYRNGEKAAYFRLVLKAYGASNASTPRTDIWTQPSEDKTIRQKVGHVFYTSNLFEPILSSYTSVDNAVSYNSRKWEYTKSGTFYIPYEGQIYSFTGKEYTITLRFYQDGTIQIEKLNGTLETLESGSRTFDDGVLIHSIIGVNNTQYCAVSSMLIVDENLEGEPCESGGSFSFANGLGLKTAADAFKLYMQLTCSSAYADVSTKTIRFVPISQLYANKGIAKDWTDKLAKESETRSFVLDSYAQNNIIEAKENPASGLVDAYTFIVNNETIEAEKTLFSLALTSQKGRSMPYYIKQESDDGKVTYNYKKLSAPICIIADPQYDNRPIALETDLEEAYTPIKDMLKGALSLSASFYLTALDIESFYHFIPIYLEQYGAYFYVNKISNFIEGKLTSVELIRL